MTDSQEIAAVVTLSRLFSPSLPGLIPFPSGSSPGRRAFPLKPAHLLSARVRAHQTRPGSARSISHASLSGPWPPCIVTLTGPPKPGARHPRGTEARSQGPRCPALFPDQLLKFQGGAPAAQAGRLQGHLHRLLGPADSGACLGDGVGAQLPLGPNLPGADAQPSAFMRASGGVLGVGVRPACGCIAWAARSLRHQNA